MNDNEPVKQVPLNIEPGMKINAGRTPPPKAINQAPPPPPPPPPPTKKD